MKFKILKHAYGLIVRNFGMAMRIMLLPWLVMTVASVFLPELLDILVTFVAGIWIVVGWHRFLLVNEVPTSYWPKWHSDLNWKYFVQALLIGFIMCVPIIAYGLIILAIVTILKVAPNDFPILFALFSFLSYALVSYLSLRMSLGLPGAAVGTLIIVGESWAETKPYRAEIFGASIVIMILYIPAIFIPLPLIAYVLGGLTTLLSISVLTTLYGVIKEGRELS